MTVKEGRYSDNIYIERFWRSVKREEFYLNDYASVKALKKAIDAYIEFYNNKRWHQSSNYKTPADVYFGKLEKEKGRLMDKYFVTDNILSDKCEAVVIILADTNISLPVSLSDP